MNSRTHTSTIQARPLPTLAIPAGNSYTSHVSSEIGFGSPETWRKQQAAPLLDAAFLLHIHAASYGGLCGGTRKGAPVPGLVFQPRTVCHHHLEVMTAGSNLPGVNHD